MRTRVSGILAAVVLAGCASPDPVVAHEGGWLGRGARFERTVGDGPRWGFGVAGDDLVLWREDARLVFEDAVGDDGLFFGTPEPDRAEPSVTFRTAVGDVLWQGRDVRRGERSWHLEGGEQRVAPGDDPTR